MAYRACGGGNRPLRGRKSAGAGVVIGRAREGNGRLSTGGGNRPTTQSRAVEPVAGEGIGHFCSLVGEVFSCSSPAKRATLRHMHSTDSSQLILEIPQDAPRPTGDPWLISPVKPASVPVPLPVIMVRVEGSYTALDR